MILAEQEEQYEEEEEEPGWKNQIQYFSTMSLPQSSSNRI